MNDSKLVINQENLRRLNEAMARMGVELQERAVAAGKQAGEVFAKMIRHE